MIFIWRLSAFGFSGVAFAWHLWHERFRLGSSPRSAAWHTAAAAGLGGFALALAANIHDLGAPAGFRPKMLVALVAWPLITGAPAFVVALVVASLHERWRGPKPPV